MSTSSTRVALSLLAILGAAGCEDYTKLGDACDPGFTGKKSASPEAVLAFDHLNCYRRLSGVSKASHDQYASDAAVDELNYILLNPDPLILGGPEGMAGYLQQQEARDGFTGYHVRDRLDHAGYYMYDPGGTEVWEGLAVQFRDPGEEKYDTVRAVDEAMRSTSARQGLLQPSWSDGGYAEIELDQEWLATAGATAESATVHYMIVIHQVPHLEHASLPVLLPKEDQTGVPLYAPATDVRLVYQPVKTTVSYPVTFLVGTLDETNYSAIDQNPFEVAVSDPSIVVAATQEALLTHVVHPGDEPFEIWPDGNRQRWIVGLYTPAPFEPSTEYEVHADVSTVDGAYRVEYNFTTAATDPGLELQPPPVDLSVDPVPTGYRVSQPRDEMFAGRAGQAVSPSGFLFASKSTGP